MYKIKTLLILFILTACAGSIKAQQFFAYSDTFGFLYTYENGVIKKMEDRAVANYKLGASFTAYVTRMDELKVSSSYGPQRILNNIPASYSITRNMMAFSYANTLYAYWKNKTQKLCPLHGNYSVADSMVVYFDRTGALNAYYDEQIWKIDQQPVVNFKVNSNTIAFNSAQGTFKMFYAGKLKKLEIYEVKDYKIGRDIVSYITGNNSFKIVDKKHVMEIDQLAPKAYFPAFEQVLYITAREEFMVYYNGKIDTLENFTPQQYIIQDNIIIWQNRNNITKMYNKGVITVLENYWPTSISILNDILVYKNVYGQAVIVKNNKKDLFTEVVNDIRINGELIVFYTNINELVFVDRNGELFRLKFNWKPF